MTKINLIKPKVKKPVYEVSEKTVAEVIDRIHKYWKIGKYTPLVSDDFEQGFLRGKFGIKTEQKKEVLKVDKKLFFEILNCMLREKGGKKCAKKLE